MHGSWEERDTSEWGKHQLPEILPDFIQGWYLFMDSGLDVMERKQRMLSFGATSESEQLKKGFASIAQMQISGKETQRRADICPTWRWTKETNRRAMQQNGPWMSWRQRDTPQKRPVPLLRRRRRQERHGYGWRCKMRATHSVTLELANTLCECHARSETRRQGWRWQPVGADGVVQTGHSLLPASAAGGPHKIADCKEKPKGVELSKPRLPQPPKRLRLCSGHHRTHRSRAAHWHGEPLR